MEKYQSYKAERNLETYKSLEKLKKMIIKDKDCREWWTPLERIDDEVWTSSIDDIYTLRINEVIMIILLVAKEERIQSNAWRHQILHNLRKVNKVSLVFFTSDFAEYYIGGFYPDMQIALKKLFDLEKPKKHVTALFSFLNSKGSAIKANEFIRNLKYAKIQEELKLSDLYTALTTIDTY